MFHWTIQLYAHAYNFSTLAQDQRNCETSKSGGMNLLF